MNRKQMVIHAVVGVIIVFIGWIILQEISQVFTAAETWCQSHNGTIVGVNETIKCELPNGTVTDVPQNVTNV